MAEVMLVAPTGSARRLDAVVQVVLSRFAAALPRRLRAAYVLGSYADASAVTTSDLDLELIVADRFAEGELARVQAFLAEYPTQAAVELDIEVKDEASLRGVASPMLKLGSRLLWGDDLRPGLALIPLVEWTRDRMHTSYWRLAGLFARPLPLTTPLRYPDPTDEFYGYARRLMRLPDGQEAPGTRDLIRSVGWMATALVAYQAGQYVATKRACAPVYREFVGGEWASLVEDMAEWVRGAWQCRIPTARQDRTRLRAVCARTLGFENHFLGLYLRYAQEELCGVDPRGRRLAREALERIPLADMPVDTEL